MPRLLRTLMHQHTRAAVDGFDPLKPWGFIFLSASQDATFWETEVRTPALLYAARGAANSGRSHDRPAASSNPPPTKRSRQGAPQAPAGGGGKGSGDVCNNWNAGRCSNPCPHGRVHKCSGCGGSHTRDQCSVKPKAAKGSGKAKGKGRGKSQQS